MINLKFCIKRPFGPVICKVTMPQNIIENLNDYVDQIIKDEKKGKELNHGKNLAGNVQQEFNWKKTLLKKVDGEYF